MVSTVPDAADIAVRRKALNRFSCLRVAPTLSPEEQGEIRETLLLFNALSEYQTLGICADDLADRKSTRLNSSHRCNTYAVFCLKKKKQLGNVHLSQ